MKVARLSFLYTGRLYRQEVFLVPISVRDWVDLRVIVRPEGLYEWKIPMTPSGIDPATFRFVAQFLNQMRHRVLRKSNEYYKKSVFICSLRYPACSAHAPYYHMTCTAPHYFPTLSHKWHRFRKTFLNIKYVFRISLQLLSEIFFTPKRLERCMIVNVYWSLCKVHVIIVKL
jgi:hypothetical protein